MQQLTSNDAMFLYMEHATSYGHVGGLQILVGPKMPEVRTGEAHDGHIEAFLQTVPFSRRRLVELPLKLGHPYWIDDPDFDLEYHWRQTAIPPPGRGAGRGGRVPHRVTAARPQPAAVEL